MLYYFFQTPIHGLVDNIQFKKFSRLRVKVMFSLYDNKKKYTSFTRRVLPSFLTSSNLGLYSVGSTLLKPVSAPPLRCLQDLIMKLNIWFLDLHTSFQILHLMWPRSKGSWVYFVYNIQHDMMKSQYCSEMNK